jgi:hypothetical protein
LRSLSGGTEVVVVRASADEFSIECSGEPMVPIEPGDQPVQEPPSPSDIGVLLGKRYEHSALGIEVLCTKAGAGPLTISGEPLSEKGAKPLPSSD